MKKQDRNSKLSADLKRADTKKMRDANGAPKLEAVVKPANPAKKHAFSGNFLFPQPRK